MGKEMVNDKTVQFTKYWFVSQGGGCFDSYEMCYVEKNTGQLKKLYLGLDKSNYKVYIFDSNKKYGYFEKILYEPTKSWVNGERKITIYLPKN